MCYDDNGASKFSCTCTSQYFGERCEMDRCVSNDCLNGGTCVIALIDDVPTQRCDCLINFGGPNCNLDLCSGIECGSGICIGGNCECNTNYINVDNTCEQTCSSSPCQAPIRFQ